MRRSRWPSGRPRRVVFPVTVPAELVRAIAQSGAIWRTSATSNFTFSLIASNTSSLDETLLTERLVPLLSCGFCLVATPLGAPGPSVGVALARAQRPEELRES